MAPKGGRSCSPANRCSSHGRFARARTAGTRLRRIAGSRRDDHRRCLAAKLPGQRAPPPRNRFRVDGASVDTGRHALTAPRKIGSLGMGRGVVTCAHRRTQNTTKLTMSDANAERAVPYLARILQQHLIDDPEGAMLDRGGLPLFADIPASRSCPSNWRARRPRRRGTDHRNHRRQLRVDSEGRLRERRQPAQVRRRRASAVVHGDGTRRAPVSPRCGCAANSTTSAGSSCRVQKSRCRCRRACTPGAFHFFAVGTSHLEMLPTGPAWSRTVAMEHAANAGEILVSAETAALFPAECLGEPRHRRPACARATGPRRKGGYIPRPQMPPEPLRCCCRL